MNDAIPDHVIAEFEYRERQQKMAPETQARWDSWCDSRIALAVYRQTGLLIDSSSSVVEERIFEETSSLRGEINSLRDDVASLRAEMSEMVSMIEELCNDLLMERGMVSRIGGKR
jgi:hypothetical protein